MTGNLSLFSSLALLATSILSPALATSFIERPFPSTVEEAPNIVRGKVGMKYSDYSQADGEGGKQRRIYTFYELQVTEVLKGGAPSNSLIMREIGGEKDGVGMQVAGASDFQRGEDVVVMLAEKTSDGSYPILGLMMGKYNVEKAPDGSEYLTGAGLTDGGPDDGHGHSPPGGGANSLSEPKWTLESLRHLIRQQGSAPAANAGDQNTAANPQLTASATPSSTQVADAQQKAPALQNISERGQDNESDAANEGKVLWLALGIGALGLVGFLVALGRSRKP